MENFGFEIPFRLPGLNEYIDSCRTNRYKGAKMKEEVEESLLWVMQSVKRMKIKIECPVFIHFIWHEQTRRRDKDNVAFAKKFILDAMQKSGMLPNDNNRYILGFSDSFVYGEGDKVRVIISEEKESG